MLNLILSGYNRRILRVMRGHSGAITDFSFSKNGLYALSAPDLDLDFYYLPKIYHLLLTSTF